MQIVFSATIGNMEKLDVLLFLHFFKIEILWCMISTLMLKMIRLEIFRISRKKWLHVM